MFFESIYEFNVKSVQIHIVTPETGFLVLS